MGVRKITDNCCGCSACANVCDKKAVYMEKDINGFEYANIDTSLCINCKKCEIVCPDLKCEKHTPEDAYAATSLDKSASKSSSGGIFAVIAKKFMERYEGIVYGTTMLPSFDACVVGIDSIEKLPLLQGSKYVQSNMGDIYKEIEHKLNDGKKVLFCGAPCQTSALKNFIGESSDLYTVDIVCHGVPNNQMFKDYICFLEKKYGKSVLEFIFRDKSQGQDTRGKFLFSSGKEKKIKYYQSSYYALFMNGSIYRESCYACKYASIDRVGDITLCDYWGVDIEEPEFSMLIKKKGLVGISGVLINSARGKEIIDIVKDSMLYVRTTKEKIAAHNHNLMKPSYTHKDRNKVFALYKKGGYCAVDRFYHQKYRVKNISRSIYGSLPFFIKEKINRLRGNSK